MQLRIICLMKENSEINKKHNDRKEGIPWDFQCTPIAIYTSVPVLYYPANLLHLHRFNKEAQVLKGLVKNVFSIFDNIKTGSTGRKQRTIFYS